MIAAARSGAADKGLVVVIVVGDRQLLRHPRGADLCGRAEDDVGGRKCDICAVDDAGDRQARQRIRIDIACRRDAAQRHRACRCVEGRVGGGQVVDGQRAPRAAKIGCSGNRAVCDGQGARGADRGIANVGRQRSEYQWSAIADEDRVRAGADCADRRQIVDGDGAAVGGQAGKTLACHRVGGNSGFAVQRDAAAGRTDDVDRRAGGHRQIGPGNEAALRDVDRCGGGEVAVGVDRSAADNPRVRRRQDDIRAIGCGRIDDEAHRRRGEGAKIGRVGARAGRRDILDGHAFAALHGDIVARGEIGEVRGGARKHQQILTRRSADDGCGLIGTDAEHPRRRTVGQRHIAPRRDVQIAVGRNADNRINIAPVGLRRRGDIAVGIEEDIAARDVSAVKVRRREDRDGAVDIGVVHRDGSAIAKGKEGSVAGDGAGERYAVC